MDNTFYITDDVNADTLTVQKIECNNCHHYILESPERAREILDDWQNFKCPLCWHEKGILKINKFVKCGACNQVMDDRKARDCYCVVRTPSIKTVGSEKNPQLQKIQNDIEDSKTQRILADKVRKARLEPELRQERIEKLLEKTVTLLELKEAKEDLQNVS